MSLDVLPLNQRTMPLNRPVDSRSELELESDKSVFSLCRGVNVGRMFWAFLRKLLIGLWRAPSSPFSVSRRLCKVKAIVSVCILQHATQTTHGTCRGGAPLLEQNLSGVLFVALEELCLARL